MRLHIFSLNVLMVCALATSFAEYSVGAVARIMPVGDSLTAGNTNAPTWSIPFTFGYRGPLYTDLTAASYDFQFVGNSGEPWNLPYGADFGLPTTIQGPDLRTVGQDNHRGYAGATTSQILNGGSAGGSSNTFPNIAAMTGADDSDVVLLMIGTNGPADGMAAIDPLVYEIVTTKPEAHLIVAQIPPRASSGTGPSDPTVQYNTYIRDTVVPKYQALGANVSTVDQFANFLTPGGTIDTSLFCPDGAHMQPAANELLGQTWSDAIVAGPPTVPDLGVISLGRLAVPAGNAATFTAPESLISGEPAFTGGAAPLYTGSGWADWEQMSDGYIGPADATDCMLLDNITDSPWAIWTLDMEANPFGYDLQSIQSFAGFNQDRPWQGMEIKYALMGETITEGEELAHTLGSFHYQPGGLGMEYNATKMTIMDTGSETMLSGVSAIQIKFIDNGFTQGDQTNLTSYREVSVIGVARLGGDANKDGSVDVSDLGILAAHYGATSGVGWSEADFNGDGVVDVSDLGVLAANYGTVPSAQSVPEPSAFAGLLVLFLAGITARCRCRHI
ncbi:MAG: hypothetical protein JXM70_08010 [Pirellulales bacterium]|nr:hypothetical protein [Pirellulales bacterium]